MDALQQANISVNIVTWNSMAYLPSLFDSLDEQDADFRIIVVDNASTDGSGSFVTDGRPHVTMLRNMNNFGFTRGHNQAIQLSLSGWQGQDLANRYIFVCNPDLECDPKCLSEMTKFMDEHPDIDACMPKLYQAHMRIDEADQKTTDRTNILDATGMVLTKARRAYDRGASEPDQGQYDGSIEIFGVCGAASFFRASSVIRIMDENQFYDDAFFAYKEDLDIAWTMRRLNMKSAFVPSAIAWHHRRAPSQPRHGWLKAFKSRQYKPAFVNYLSTRNHTWTLLKHLHASDLFFHAPWIIPYEFAKLIAALLSLASLKGYLASIGGLGRISKQRKRLTRLNSLSPAEFRKLLV
ncbi:glycosyltransferase [Patescibacteria group bacterium]|nr:glycosyltransferase [Patescibacteria group bacterium]